MVVRSCRARRAVRDHRRLRDRPAALLPRTTGQPGRDGHVPDSSLQPRTRAVRRIRRHRRGRRPRGRHRRHRRGRHHRRLRDRPAALLPRATGQPGRDGHAPGTGIRPHDRPDRRHAGSRCERRQSAPHGRRQDWHRRHGHRDRRHPAARRATAPHRRRRTSRHRGRGRRRAGDLHSRPAGRPVERGRLRLHPGAGRHHRRRVASGRRVLAAGGVPPHHHLGQPRQTARGPGPNDHRASVRRRVRPGGSGGGTPHRRHSRRSSHNQQ